MSLHTAMNAPRRSGRICACTGTRRRLTDAIGWRRGRNLGCEYTDLDGCRIDPRNCPEYISCEDYHEQEEFYE